MATSVTNVTAGTTTAPIAINSGQSVFLGPQVGGGSVTLQWSQTQSGPWYTWGPGASVQGASFRLPGNITYGWIQATAATQAATLAISDILGVSPNGELVSISAPMSSDNAATTEQILFSMRIPPLALSTNFSLRVSGYSDFTNNGNAKTLQCRINGVAGTLFYQSGALASHLTMNFMASAAGMGDGVSWKGFGSGLTNIGLGINDTAFTTLSRDYIGQETEIVITCTKATASDAFILEQVHIALT